MAEIDNIEDPLPFDIDAPIIEIADKDYAVWYADMTEEEAKYYGKTIRFKGRSLLGGGLKDDEVCHRPSHYDLLRGGHPVRRSESPNTRTRKAWSMAAGSI